MSIRFELRRRFLNRRSQIHTQLESGSQSRTTGRRVRFQFRRVGAHYSIGGVRRAIHEGCGLDPLTTLSTSRNKAHDGWLTLPRRGFRTMAVLAEHMAPVSQFTTSTLFITTVAVEDIWSLEPIDSRKNFSFRNPRNRKQASHFHTHLY